MDLKNPAADWLREAVEQVRALTGLKAGWDSYSAPPVGASSAIAAVQFLMDNAFAALPRPAVVPTNDGGVQIEWHRAGIDLEFCFAPNESGVFIEDAADEWAGPEEASLGEASAILKQLLPRLSSKVA